ncbi:RNA polymerase sigma factor SigM [Fodinicola feengrottensis]|uniref:RNA polymerase sigma factor SigM n=1 Tax=Fodinicola feengrottensis TaxID=435914 RepID=A0ABP4STK1_9ACTN|nr:RNA polymerase sigma factor SigM [Fodinicola feengrottensis]
MTADPTAVTPSDIDLLSAHAAGDKTAFSTLLSRHQDRMWAIALRTTANREDAADALQDACLSAFRAAASFRGDAAVTTWLHRIVVNASLDRLRRKAARPAVPLDDTKVDPPDPADQVDALTTRLTIREALAALPLEQRAALVLVDLEGLPVDQAADILKIPAGTVKSRCARGRARLAVLLDQLRPSASDHGRNGSTARRVPSKNDDTSDVAGGGKHG